MTKTAVHLHIYGRVQGFGYRAWTAGQARKRGLSGWVRNRADGTVEAVFSGDNSAVETMIELAAKGRWRRGSMPLKEKNGRSR